MVAATVAASEPRIEIVGERRRAHDAEFRTRLVEASWRPGARVQDLARRHGICASLIYRWRRSASPRVAPSAVEPGAAVPAGPGVAVAVERPLEFVPIGVFGRAEDGEPALVAKPKPAGDARAAPAPARVTPRPAPDERPGLIEIDLADGTRLRVDAFVNERALRRVLAVLKAAP